MACFAGAGGGGRERADARSGRTSPSNNWRLPRDGWAGPGQGEKSFLPECRPIWFKLRLTCIGASNEGAGNALPFVPSKTSARPLTRAFGIVQLDAPGLSKKHSQCAVERRSFLAGANPVRQFSLRPVATGVDVKVTTRRKPLVEGPYRLPTLQIQWRCSGRRWSDLQGHQGVWRRTLVRGTGGTVEEERLQTGSG